MLHWLKSEKSSSKSLQRVHINIYLKGDQPPAQQTIEDGILCALWGGEKVNTTQC